MSSIAARTLESAGWLWRSGEHGIEVFDGSGARRNELVESAPKSLDIEKHSRRSVRSTRAASHRPISQPSAVARRVFVFSTFASTRLRV